MNQLTDEEKRIIEGKSTERPFSGEYDDFTKRELIFAANAIILYFLLMLNLMPNADGLLLTNTLKEL